MAHGPMSKESGLEYLAYLESIARNSPPLVIKWVYNQQKNQEIQNDKSCNGSRGVLGSRA